MFTIFRRYYFYVNAIFYVFCKLHIYNNNLLLKITNTIIMIFLPEKYKYKFSERSKYFEYKMNREMDYNALKVSFSYIAILFIPLSLALANLISLLLPIDMLYLYGLMELMLTFPIWKNMLNEKVLRKQFMLYERLSPRHLTHWRLLLLGIILCDIFLIVLLAMC